MSKVKDIFQKAKFGDKFITKNGFVAVFLGWARTTVSGDEIYYFTLQTQDDPIDTRWHNNVEYRCDGKYFEHMNNPDGRWNIISSYKESINEDKQLDDEISLLQCKGIEEATNSWIPQHKSTMYPFDDQSYVQGVADGIDYGYRKAKEIKLKFA